MADLKFTDATATAEEISAIDAVIGDERAVIHEHERLVRAGTCLLYTSPSPRDKRQSRMPSSA